MWKPYKTACECNMYLFEQDWSHHIVGAFAHIWRNFQVSLFPTTQCTGTSLPCWETEFSNHRNGFLWQDAHNERGWISIVEKMQLNKHYAAQTQWYLESYSESPSVLARCWRLIRDSALKELFFILSVPLPMKETNRRQWPKLEAPAIVGCHVDVKKQEI